MRCDLQMTPQECNSSSCSINDSDLIHVLLSCTSNIHLHVSHASTLYRVFPWVQSVNIFVLVSGNLQQNTSTFGGNGKSGWNHQEQCIAWIPLQCGVPVAKRANGYSAAMVMTCKTGESPSNGTPPEVDTHFRTRLNWYQDRILLDKIP